MKPANLSIPSILILIIGILASSKTFSGSADSIVFENDSVFTIESVQDELSKDGDWIKVNKDEIDPEGVTDGSDVDENVNTDYVWRPYGVGPDWTPYTNGYWVYTNCGWMWYSYYTWGWRTCHYGRWWWHPAWGWVWSPGYVWAPAWVVWIYYDGYCGWYPISPRIRWHHRHHRWYCHNMRFHVRHWTFCETKEFTGGPGKPIVIVDPPGIQGSTEIFKKGKIYTEVKVENEKVVNKGPDATDIEKSSGKKVQTEDVTKYNNVRIVEVKEKVNTNNGEKVKYNEKQSTGDKQKNTETRTSEKQRNDDGKKSEEKKDQGNKNSENKSNDKEKVKQPEKKYEQPKQYTPPPQEKQKQNDPPPKNDDRNQGNNNNGKQDMPVNKDNGSGKDNNSEKKK